MRVLVGVALALAVPIYGLYFSGHAWPPDWLTGMAAIAIGMLAYTAFDEFAYSTGRRKLILDANGFDYHGTLRRHRRWHEVRDFRLTFYKSGAYVEFSESAPRSLGWWIRTGFGRTNLIFEKFETLTSEELCDLLNRWRARALAESGSRSAQ